MNPAPADDLGFAYTARKDGAVEVWRHDRLVTVLRGAEARKFAAKVAGCTSEQAQQLMARLTGNYKRGNERAARAHPRNRD
ncbi:MAG: hypothetical protein ABTQ73_00515 [Caldilineales bacterium]